MRPLDETDLENLESRARHYFSHPADILRLVSEVRRLRLALQDSGIIEAAEKAFKEQVRGAMRDDKPRLIASCTLPEPITCKQGDEIRVSYTLTLESPESLPEPDIVIEDKTA